MCTITTVIAPFFKINIRLKYVMKVDHSVPDLDALLGEDLEKTSKQANKQDLEMKADSFGEGHAPPLPINSALLPQNKIPCSTCG